MSILGGIRTRDLWIRSPARYPLRYEDIPKTIIISILILLPCLYDGKSPAFLLLREREKGG